MQVKNLARTAVLGVAALASASSFAFMENYMDFDGVYILGGIGYAGIDNANFGDRHGQNPNGVSGTNLEAAGELAWRGGFGAWMTDNFALEFNYIGVADINEDRNGGSFDGTTPSGYAQLNTTSSMFYDISGVGRCFFADDFWGFARIGLALGSIDREAYLNHVQVSGEENTGLGYSLGVGAQFDFTEMFGLRLEGSTVQATNDVDVYAVTANLVINFEELM